MAKPEGDNYNFENQRRRESQIDQVLIVIGQPLSSKEASELQTAFSNEKPLEANRFTGSISIKSYGLQTTKF